MREDPWMLGYTYPVADHPGKTTPLGVVTGWTPPSVAGRWDLEVTGFEIPLRQRS
jgi:hypothetical protein